MYIPQGCFSLSVNATLYVRILEVFHPLQALAECYEYPFAMIHENTSRQSTKIWLHLSSTIGCLRSLLLTDEGYCM